MRAFLAYPTMVVMTLLLGLPVVVVSMFGVRISPDSVLGRAGKWWSMAVLKSAGVKVVVRNPQNLSLGDSRVYVSNHVSWFEIFALATVLPRFRFVTKKELAAIPVFGPAVRQVAGVFIDRGNRKAAFETYRGAAEQIRSGLNVAVYPEGTRGRSYELRPFKKGPFVLAIAAQVPVVPVLSWGTREVQAKGELAIHAGTAELTFLEPVPTEGLTYEDRDELLETVWNRIAKALEEKGIATHQRPMTEERPADRG